MSRNIKVGVQAGKGLLTIAKQIAKILDVPVSKLTTKMITGIQQSKLPIGYKKLLQGKTSGEGRIQPSIMSSRAVAGAKVKAGISAVAVTEGARAIVAAAKAAKANENKNPRKTLDESLAKTGKAAQDKNTAAARKARLESKLDTVKERAAQRKKQKAVKKAVDETAASAREKGIDQPKQTKSKAMLRPRKRPEGISKVKTKEQLKGIRPKARPKK
tara:strand:- start:233 stop:880 length:648 start_codon:yes stop_codon:yes gene_type:complete